MVGNNRVRVDTTRLRQAAGGMDELGDKAKDIVTTLKNAIQAQGNPWGHDDYGDKFVKGDKGYAKSEENLLAGGDNMVDSAGRFSKGMSDAAAKMDDMDAR
ncbi:hypothetical protein ABZ942_35340 [Nocardia sp. NPDC046473]|uniref:hypothetical protein n=1 Tax=Nocardia sp. NPDC046473 TaxID=3155733 RepID=UPI0033D3BC39